MTTASRKIVKAIYLLLAKYHRLYGLEVYSFSHGGFGPGYFGFQVAANRCWWGDSLRDANYECANGLEPEYGPLVGYWFRASIPAWAASDQLTMEGWEGRRTAEIVAWFEEKMSLHRLFNENKHRIDAWRKHYSVEDSEKYLLMINLAGLVASRSGTYPLIPSQTFSEYDSNATAKVAGILRSLGLQPNEEAGCVFGLEGVFIGRNGKALVESAVVDLWGEYTLGASPTELLDLLKPDLQAM